MKQFEITIVLEDNWTSRKEIIDAGDLNKAEKKGYQLEKDGETLVDVKMSNEEKLQLTEKQKKAMNAFERAFKNCKKVGIRFYSVLGQINALNGEYLIEINDVEGDVNLQYVSFPSIYDGDLCSWADDTHYAKIREDAHAAERQPPRR
jgi:uncharacterized protein YkuJ